MLQYPQYSVFTPLFISRFMFLLGDITQLHLWAKGEYGRWIYNVPGTSVEFDRCCCTSNVWRETRGNKSLAKVRSMQVWVDFLVDLRTPYGKGNVSSQGLYSSFYPQRKPGEGEGVKFSNMQGKHEVSWFAYTRNFAELSPDLTLFYTMSVTMYNSNLRLAIGIRISF